MLTPEQLADLRAKAQAANYKCIEEWKVEPIQNYDGESYELKSISGAYIGELHYAYDGKNNAAFIAAANPATILKLLSRIDFLEKEVVSYKWVAEQAWGGEIPSPYPGHHSSYEQFIESMEHHNCPCCGGSGHVDDCDSSIQEVKAKIERLEKEADWLAGRLPAGEHNDTRAEAVRYWRLCASKAIKESK